MATATTTTPLRPSTTHWLAADVLPVWLRAPLRSLLISSLQLGPIPAHVGFIMDGNRRWARTRSRSGQEKSNAAHGHTHGFDALKGLLAFLWQIGVTQVSVYAFALDNFKRSPEEVDVLMQLAKSKLLDLAQQGEQLERHGVRVFVVGRTESLPLDVQDACRQVEALTAHNSRASLNVCVAYSSQDEMAAAVQRVAASPTTTTSNLSTADTTAALDAALYTSRNPHWTAPDLLVRTSGVARLSDYLLWQIAQHTALFVLPCFWPDIGIADVVPVLLAWQAQACLVALSSWLRLA